MEQGYKSCPHCAEPIRDAANVCRYCNRSVFQAISTISPPDLTSISSPRSGSSKFRLGVLTAILIALLFVALPNVFRNRGPVPTIDVSRGQSVFASRIWRPIGRKQVLDQTLYVGRTQFWNVTGEPSVSGFKTRYTLGGRWASNETLAFVVIDPEDVNRLHAGSPPLIAYERHDGSLQVP